MIKTAFASVRAAIVPAAFAALCGLVSPAAAVPSGANDLCTFGADWAATVGGTTYCQGAWTDNGQTDVIMPTGDVAASESVLNDPTADGGYMGVTGWKLVAEIDGITSTTNSSVTFASAYQSKFGYDAGSALTLSTIANTSGKAANYAVGDIGSATRAALVVLADMSASNSYTSWAVYTLDVADLAGIIQVASAASELHNGAKATLRSVQLYLYSDVPVPAAAPLLLTAFAGLAALGRRRRAAA